MKEYYDLTSNDPFSIHSHFDINASVVSKNQSDPGRDRDLTVPFNNIRMTGVT